PLGRAIGQFANKYIIAESVAGLVVIDQHAAHERITYEKMRMGRMKTQPLLVPIIVQMRDDFADAIAEFADEFREAGLVVEKFGPGAIAIVEKPAEWDLEWGALLTAAAQEIIGAGHTSRVAEKLHLSLANRACHNSVRSGRRLSIDEQNALLREIENTERGGQCNHGRPVYRVFSVGELDGMFERK
ncbi:MAG: hypothetical protein LBR41_00100, partial [Rickettsiales bacterium]|nr:hypothetical protein [Rickettsiales bacterium]